MQIAFEPGYDSIALFHRACKTEQGDTILGGSGDRLNRTFYSHVARHLAEAGCLHVVVEGDIQIIITRLEQQRLSLIAELIVCLLFVQRV